MKRFLKYLVSGLLMACAQVVIRRYRPTIVMVTGSVGKTSTKDAVAAALSAQFFVRKSHKSFNSEFGVPFTVFGVGNPWGSPREWYKVIKAAIALMLLPNHYPKVLVLEVGADRPGDLTRILRIATPNAVVVTRLPEIPVHVESYASPEEVHEEEFSPAFALSPGAPLVLPADDVHARELALRTSAEIITYGTSEEAQCRVTKTDFCIVENRVIGMLITLSCGGATSTYCVKGSVGYVQALPIAAALAVARALGVDMTRALESLKEYEPPPGRGRLLVGKEDSVLIDDTYNASPAAVEEALETLKHFPKVTRRVAILGDMLELGRYSISEHERIGALAAQSVDVLITVGVRARRFAEAARAQKMPDDRIHSFDDSRSAAGAVAALVRGGDAVLIKGSQSVRLERVVEVLLKDSGDVSKLVRQEPEWKRR